MFKVNSTAEMGSEAAGEEAGSFPRGHNPIDVLRNSFWCSVRTGRLYGYPSETYNFNTRLLEVAARPELRTVVGEAAYDAASYLVPVDPNPAHRWIGQGTLFPSERWSCSPGDLWDFFGRSREEIYDDLMVWASDSRMQNQSGMCNPRLLSALA